MPFAEVIAAKVAARRNELLERAAAGPLALAARYVAAAEALTGDAATEQDLRAAFTAAEAALRDVSSLPAAATVLAGLVPGRAGLSSSGWAVSAEGARQFNRGSGAAFAPLLPSVT